MTWSLDQLPRETSCGYCGNPVGLPPLNWSPVADGWVQRLPCPACGSLVIAVFGSLTVVHAVEQASWSLFDEAQIPTPLPNPLRRRH